MQTFSKAESAASLVEQFVFEADVALDSLERDQN